MKEEIQRNWKDRLAKLVFGWNTLAAADKPEIESEEKWRIQTTGYALAAKIVTRAFSWNGYVGIPLSLCMELDEPLIMGDKAGIHMTPEQILNYIEDVLKSEIISGYAPDGKPIMSELEPILYNCIMGIKMLKQDCLCQHDWYDSQFPETIVDENGKTITIPVEYCVHCGAERDKVFYTTKDFN